MKMKTQNVIMALALAVICLACNNKPVVNTDKTLVESLMSMSTEAFNSGDVNKILNIYTDDGIMLNGLVKISGKDSLAKSFTYMFQHSSNFKYFPALWSVQGDMVFIEGLFTFDWNMNGTVSQGKGVMKDVFVKQPDNSWKITYSEENHGDVMK